MVGYLIAPNRKIGQGERFKELLAYYENIIGSSGSQNDDEACAADRIISIAKGTRNMGKVMGHEVTIERIELLKRIKLEL